MGETRDRGVLASTECIQKLKEAQSRQRNAEGKVWTLTDVGIESGVDAKTVSRFLNQKSKVDETTAIAICQTLGVKFEADIDRFDTDIEADRTGQLSMNPFIYGDPVPPEKFCGRRQAILEVKNRIGAIASQSVNIVGLRRIEKTSLLRYVRSNPTEFIQPERQPLASHKGMFEIEDRACSVLASILVLSSGLSTIDGLLELWIASRSPET